MFKDLAVRTFLLFFYNQVLGMPAFYVSLALALRNSVTRERHTEIRQRLDARHAGNPSHLN